MKRAAKENVDSIVTYLKTGSLGKETKGIHHIKQLTGVLSGCDSEHFSPEQRSSLVKAWNVRIAGRVADLLFRPTTAIYMKGALIQLHLERQLKLSAEEILKDLITRLNQRLEKKEQDQKKKPLDPEELGKPDFTILLSSFKNRFGDQICVLQTALKLKAPISWLYHSYKFPKNAKLREELLTLEKAQVQHILHEIAGFPESAAFKIIILDNISPAIRDAIENPERHQKSAEEARKSALEEMVQNVQQNIAEMRNKIAAENELKAKLLDKNASLREYRDNFKSNEKYQFLCKLFSIKLDLSDNKQETKETLHTERKESPLPIENSTLNSNASFPALAGRKSPPSEAVCPLLKELSEARATHNSLDQEYKNLKAENAALQVQNDTLAVQIASMQNTIAGVWQLLCSQSVFSDPVEPWNSLGSQGLFSGGAKLSARRTSDSSGSSLSPATTSPSSSSSPSSPSSDLPIFGS